MSMESYGKHKNAGGRDPDFGAIFMSSSATIPECFQRRLLGLPSSYSQFVKQVKAGIILFLFEYEKRELHGVYRSCCDGAMNIVPDAFSSSGKRFPAQVEFIPIWDCKPLKESIFRDAIRENYFSPKKFNFGLSEKQVHRLLDLFSKRKLPGRQLSRMKYVKPERYPVGKVGRSVDGRMHVENVKNKQDAAADALPITMHYYQGDSFHNNGEVDDKEHSIGMQLRPTISGGLSGNLSGVVRVHEDDELQVSDRLRSENNSKPGQTMVVLGDSPGLHNSNVGLSFFSSKPMLDPDSLVQNQLRATSAMLHPIPAQISDNFFVAQGDLSSKGILLYDPDAPHFDIGQPASVRIRINDSSKSMLGSASPSNNYRRNIFHSLNDQPSHMHTELKDTNQFQDGSYGLVNHVSFESNRTSMPCYAVQNSERLAAKTFEHEGHDSFLFKSSSVPLSPLDIGNSGWGSEPYTSLYNKYNSRLSNDFCSIALEENLGYEMTLQKNNETCSPVVPWENEGRSQIQYDDPLIHEHDPDFECYGNSGRSNSGYENKSSVFSRLSFVQVSNNREYGGNNWQGEYDVCTSDSVDEVMDMVRQSHNQWRMKRKFKPLVKLGKAESLRSRKQIGSLRLTRPSFEKSLDDTSTYMTTAGEGETNQIDEDIRLVDFKRRSHVRKINEEMEIRGSNESVRSEDLGIVQQKKRKLIRPNFSKSTTPGDKDINLGSSQDFQVSFSQESLEPKDNGKSCTAVVQSEENLKIDGKEPALVCQTHFKEKSNNARGCVNSKGGGKLRDGWSISNIGLNDGSEWPEHINNQHASSSAYCEAKSFHNEEGLCMKDDINPTFRDTELPHSICQEHNEEKVVGASRYINIGEGTSKDAMQLFSVEVKDGPESERNFTNEYASLSTCEKSNCNIEKGSNMNHESQDASGVAESSEPCEDSFEKDKFSLFMTEDVDKPLCHFGEAAIVSRMPDSSCGDLNSVGISISVDRQGGERN